ncbi:monooxygenase [Lophiostoma macrostomum CBS 122681]|uniref:Monooxygenase n=1 Tax=Lophiostoma macrostomum CBS 122681 TaxID=1314788 RepID=A0A6A6SN55_9PLEO|nr:monooxygenase [Lophiostoma macrostomum CBS 122681]
MARTTAIPATSELYIPSRKSNVSIKENILQTHSLPQVDTPPKSPVSGTPQRNGENGYYRNEELGGPIHSERQLDIIVIGAGASGLCLAYKLQRSFSNFSLTMYEKNPDISGTWYENRYPGCACDVPAHNYVFSWEPKKDWSAVYVGNEEIKSYFKGFAAKYDLNRYIRVNQQVVEAAWDDPTGKWTVKVRNNATGAATERTCDILVNASGILNNWKWPDISGLDTFRGKLLHSANYDNSYELTGKHVGLIGNGSSGIQILPAIHPKVKAVTTFLRTPTWVTLLQGFEQHKYSQQELEEFATKEGTLLAWRKDAESNVNKIYTMFLNGSKMQESTFKQVRGQMQTKLKNDVDLQETLIPQWGFGCRRMTPGINYLETLCEDNFEVVFGSIDKITPDGLCAQGREYPVDVLICATGFDTSFRPRFPILGRKGQNLQYLWSVEAHSYMGVAAPEQPNYFHFLGPNCPIGSGPLVGAIGEYSRSKCKDCRADIPLEAQADYILRWCDRWQTENIQSFTPKHDAVEDFAEHTDLFMRDTIWKSGCRSWYKSNTIDGRVSALWPGSSLHYFEAMQYLRADDFEVVYKGNRFAWLGNGFSQTELDKTCDLAYYIRESDDSAFLSKGKQRQVLTKSGTVVQEPEPQLVDEDGEWRAWC